MPTAFDNIISQIDEYLKGNALAEAADVSFDNWQSHVFYGIDQGFTMEKNRGRLPFIEYELDTEDYRLDAQDGGANMISVRMRCNVGRKSKLEAQKQIKELQGRFMRQLRGSNITTAEEIDTTIEAMNSAPWGFWQDMIFEVIITYNRDEFGVDLP